MDHALLIWSCQVSSQRPYHNLVRIYTYIYIYIYIYIYNDLNINSPSFLQLMIYTSNNYFSIIPSFSHIKSIPFHLVVWYVNLVYLQMFKLRSFTALNISYEQSVHLVFSMF